MPPPEQNDKPARGGAPPSAAQSFYARQAAVALAYGPRDDAPRVVAKGRGLLARTIIERARDSGVYVHESTELVSLLMQIDLDRRIPAELYRAVAELLAWLYRIERRQNLPAPPADGEAGPRSA